MDGQARVSVYLELKNKLKTGLDQAKQYLNKNVQDMKGKLNELKNSHIQSFKAMQDQVPGFGNAMSLLGNPYALLIAGLVTVTAMFSKASAMATEFQDKMAKANVTAQQSPEALKKTGNQLLNIAASSTTKGAANAAPDAYNVLLSSGMNKKTAMDTVNPTLQAAKAGFTDIETVAKAAAATMNSSGITDATRIYDVLFATLNKGNAEFKDIAQYLPKIVPGALAAGSSLEQVSGAFAYLTAQGQTAEKSTTLLENYFKTVKDTDKAASFKKIGVDIYDAQGKLKDMVSVSNQLNTALAGLTDKQRNTVMGSLGLDQESSSAFVALSQDALKLEDTIKATTKSTGALSDAVKNAKTPMDSWVQVSNMLDVAWIKLGIGVNAVLGPIGSTVANIFTSLQDGTNIFSPVLEGLGSIFGGIWNAVSGIAVGIWQILEPLFIWIQNSNFLQFLFWGIGKIAEFIGFLVGKIGDLFSGIGTIIRTVYDNTLKPFVDTLEWIWGRINKLLGIDTKNSQVNKAKEALGDTGAAKTETPVKEAKDLLGKPSDKVQKVLAEEKDKADKKASKETGMSGGSQTKVITINKLSMIDGNFVSSNAEFAGMDKAAMEKFLQELFQRMMINLGRSYS